MRVIRSNFLFTVCPVLCFFVDIFVFTCVCVFSLFAFLRYFMPVRFPFFRPDCPLLVDDAAEDIELGDKFFHIERRFTLPAGTPCSRDDGTRNRDFARTKMRNIFNHRFDREKIAVYVQSSRTRHFCFRWRELFMFV